MKTPAASKGKGPAPTAGADRLVLLDALRGFALFGVLLVNLRSFSLYGFLPAAVKTDLPTAALDRAIGAVTAALVDGTSITLFSILFGVGFAMQMQRSLGQPDRLARHVRRMLVLLAIGMAHAWLLWWGDILRYYAVLGILLIPFARLPPAVLAGLGAFVVVVLPLLLQPIVPPLLPPQASAAESAAASLAAFGSEQWGVMLEGNLARDLRMRIAVWILPTYVLGRLLIGAAFGGSGALQRPGEHLRFWRRLCVVSVASGAAMTVMLVVASQAQGDHGMEWLGGAGARLMLRLLRNAAPLVLALAYLSAFVLVFRVPAWQHRLAWLAPIGRMALTNYLAQTLLAIGLFYGVGLGIGPSTGLVGVAAAAVGIFLAQAIGSAWWLRRYRFGPMEWVWRSLTYARLQPMRRGGDWSRSDARRAVARAE